MFFEVPTVSAAVVTMFTDMNFWKLVIIVVLFGFHMHCVVEFSISFKIALCTDVLVTAFFCSSHLYT